MGAMWKPTEGLDCSGFARLAGEWGTSDVSEERATEATRVEWEWLCRIDTEWDTAEVTTWLLIGASEVIKR